MMRRYAIVGSYEKLKELTRGERVTESLLHEFIGQLDIPDAEKERLLQMTPANYLSLAKKLAKDCT